MSNNDDLIHLRYQHTMSLSPENSASNLYCREDVDDVDSYWIPHPTPTTDSLADDDEERLIARLIDSELDHMPHSEHNKRFCNRSIDVTARQDAINWMFKVHAYYHFRPVTAYLSVNYLDRFLSSCKLPQGNGGWPFQLLSVACLSLAAKMEETSIPLLIDFQVLQPGFVFDARTVRRMELLVMTNLKWRLRSVTPFDFIHYFVSKLPCFDSQYSLFLHASDLILSTSQVMDFLGYPPSVIAAAAVLCAAGESVDLPAGGDRKMASFYERVSKEMVRSCHQLMEEYLIDKCPISPLKQRRRRTAAPASPIGILEAAAACGSGSSCDTQKSALDDNHADPSQAEPEKKRRRSV